MMFKQGSKLPKYLPWKDQPGIFLWDDDTELRELLGVGVGAASEQSIQGIK